MTTAIIVRQHGGPEVLEVEEVALKAPQAGEALVRHTAIGINYIDTYFRSGLYPPPGGTFPFSPGNEAAGVVEAVGPDVSDVKVGDRVAYLGPPGAYVQQRVLPASLLLPLPAGISDETAAAALLKGLTVQYLFRRTFRLAAQHTLLFHAAAGGVGLIAGQWARHIGAISIGTVGSEAKAEAARGAGYSHVINYRDEDFVARTLALTDGAKVDVVYDSIGRDTFPASLDIIKPLGMFVSFGQSSGPITAFDIGLIGAKGSLFVTRPSLFTYNPTRTAMLSAAEELWDLIGRGVLEITIHQRFALTEARLAHQALESRATTGASLLIP